MTKSLHSQTELHCTLNLTLKMYLYSMHYRYNLIPTRNYDEYEKHLVLTIGNDQLNAYLRHCAGHLICSYNFSGYKRPRKLKTANIYPQNAKIWRSENIPFYGISSAGPYVLTLSLLALTFVVCC